MLHVRPRDSLENFKFGCERWYGLREFVHMTNCGGY